MSAHASFHSLRRLALLAALLTTGSPSKATSIRYPKFSAPVFNEDRLIFTSPDAKRLLCFSLDGKIVWEQKFDFPIRLFTGPQSEALVQTGKVVSSVSGQSGELRAMFTVEDENDDVSFSTKVGGYVSRAFEKRSFKLLNTATGKPRWRTSEVEDVICASPEVIVCLAAQRTPFGKGYSFGKASLDGYDRKSFARKWSIALADRSGVPFVPAAFMAPYLIYADGRTALVVLDCATGHKLLTRQVEVLGNGYIQDLEIHDGKVVWLSQKLRQSDLNNSEHMLHFGSIPELVQEKVVTLKLIEIARISFEDGFIISDALYRTACFQPSGEKVWERFQTARSPAVNSRIYFSDYVKKTARLGFVELPTGKETILYSEPVREPKL